MRVRGKVRSVWVLLAALACFGAHAPPRLQVLTSIKPLQLLALAVVGDAAAVDVLLDARQSPHDYQFRPSDQARLRAASAVFWVGPSLEAFLKAPLANLPSTVRVVAWQNVEDHSDDGHLWMDPLAGAAMAQRMAQVLGELAPSERQRFIDNAQALATVLNRQDAQLRRQLAAIPKPKAYLVAHDGYRLFEQRYGLTHAGALSNSADQAPGARNLLHIHQLIDDGTIQCVVREPQSPPRLLQNVLQGHALRVVTIDGLAGDITADPAGASVFYEKLGQSMLACVG